MVAQHYRWDFIGLSTDTKPTPATSEKVVNGSTFYCSDESKLYVYCDGTWYERKPLGGGGASYIAGTGIDITDGTISLDSASQTSLAKADTAIQNTDYASSNVAGVVKSAVTYGTQVSGSGVFYGSTRTYAQYNDGNSNVLICKGTLENVIEGKGLVDQTALAGKQDTLTAGTGIDITDNVISATGGDSMIKLTTADYNWNHNTGTETNPTSVAIWKLPPGVYYRDKDDQVIVCTGKFGSLGQEHYAFIVGASYTDNNNKEQKPFTVLKENDSGLIHAIASSYVFNVTDLSGTSIDYLSNYSIYNSGSRDRVQIGGSASSSGNGNVAIGYNTRSTGNRSIAVGSQAVSSANGAIAIGSYSSATVAGQVDVGSSATSDGYNNTNYRIISGVHNGQGLHDAATVAQGNTLATSAPTTSTAGVLGQLYTDTTNMHTYQCTAISGDTYTWTQRW